MSCPYDGCPYPDNPRYNHNHPAEPSPTPEPPSTIDSGMSSPTSFCFPPDTLAKLRAQARRERRTYTAVVIRAVERYLEAEAGDELDESVSHHPSAQKSA